MVERHTRVRASQIHSVYPNDMEATNSPSDGYVPIYDLASLKFTWAEQSGGGAGGNSYFEQFTTGDLAIADIIVITHNLSTQTIRQSNKSTRNN